GVDTGGIIIQERVKVAPGETAETLQKKVLEIEHRILIDGINSVLNK
ncbi:MAG: formyltransferase family protein, partial [Anaerovoracaceae bacterium]